MTDATQPNDPRPASPVGGEALLPCPFCGGAARLAESVIPRSYGCQVGCDQCSTYKVREDGLEARVARQNAIAAWNRRAALSAPSVTGEADKRRKKWIAEAEDFAERMISQPAACEIIERLLELLAAPVSAHEGRWYAAEDIDQMVREIDVAINGDHAAPQAKLCDIFKDIIRLAALSPTALEQGSGAFPAKEPVIPTEREDAAVVADPLAERLTKVAYATEFLDVREDILALIERDRTRWLDNIAVCELLAKARQQLADHPSGAPDRPRR